MQVTHSNEQCTFALSKQSFFGCTVFILKIHLRKCLSGAYTVISHVIYIIRKNFFPTHAHIALLDGKLPISKS